MFKLFPRVCASQMQWKFVPNCWSAHTKTAAAKPSGPCAWDDDVTVVSWLQSRTSSNCAYRSVRITKVLQTSATRTIRHYQCSLEGVVLAANDEYRYAVTSWCCSVTVLFNCVTATPLVVLAWSQLLITLYNVLTDWLIKSRILHSG